MFGVPKHVFPSLFSIARYKEAWVKDNFIWRNGLVEWNVIFVRSVQDWELDVVSSFFEMLYSCKALHGNEDHICWSPSKKGTFEVKLLCPFKIMRCFHGRVFGTLRCLHKWHFLGGLRLSTKILTHDNLRKRSILIVEWCCMCTKNGESVNHLLLHCEVGY
jgi:hypothetical protein